MGDWYYMGDSYKINEIAAMYGLHPDTLRYYEEQGLLKPGRGENNYRMYGIQEICDLNIIQNLRSLDMPVARIRAYMTARTVESTMRLLEEETKLIDARIAALHTLRTGVRHRAGALRRALRLPVGEYRLLELDERRCYRLSEGVTLEKDVDYLLKKLENKHEEQLRRIGDRRMGAVLDAGWLEKGVYNRYSHAFFICEDIEDYDDVLPQGRYASVVYAGGYENVARMLPGLLEYGKKMGLRAIGTPMELYHIDIHDSGRLDEFLTEIQVLVG